MAKEREFDLHDRLIDYAVRIIKLCEGSTHQADEQAQTAAPGNRRIDLDTVSEHRHGQEERQETMNVGCSVFDVGCSLSIECPNVELRKRCRTPSPARSCICTTENRAPLGASRGYLRMAALCTGNPMTAWRGRRSGASWEALSPCRGWRTPRRERTGTSLRRVTLRRHES